MATDYFALACALARAEARQYTDKQLEQKAETLEQIAQAPDFYEQFEYDLDEANREELACFDRDMANGI